MPTKRNKAGNMQNYVPAGNGEPSGEYGDNATGSNRNFQGFASPMPVAEYNRKPKVEKHYYLNYLQHPRLSKKVNITTS